jgi:hypothetical protein
VRLDIPVDRSFFEEMAKAWKENRKEDSRSSTAGGTSCRPAEPVARGAARPKLEAAGVAP